MQHDPVNSTKEWDYYVGVAFHKINEEREFAKFKPYTMGRFLKKLKGLTTEGLRRLHFECESKERLGINYGKVFESKVKNGN